jgi:putative alpha-1,2-mannosidase
VRRILRKNYTTLPDGIPGKNDCCEMSSWAVLTMMGIYTVDPASTSYELVSPAFQRIVMRLEPPYKGKTFMIETSDSAPKHPYIQSVQLNDKPLSKDWMWFQDLNKRGSMHFDLGTEPNRKWAAKPQDAPQSLSESNSGR